MRITTSENDIKERLSVAYVTAVAARAGCQIAKLDIDKSSVDAIIMPISGAKSIVALQLKATSELAVSDDRVHFQLPLKNYNDLRDAASNIPHYLVILSLPPEAESWLTINSSELIIRAAAYYGNICGYPAVAEHSFARRDHAAKPAVRCGGAHKYDTIGPGTHRRKERAQCSRRRLTARR
jgi:hypothetical protein